MPIRIPRPRGITTGQLMILTAVNVFAGIYIWQPLVLQQKERKAKENSSSTASDSAVPAATEKISTTLKTDSLKETISTDTKLLNLATETISSAQSK